MSTMTEHRTSPEPLLGARARGSARRIASLARAEAILLRRNPMALLTALGGPLVVVLTQLANAGAPGSDSAGGLGRGAVVVLTLGTFGLIFGIYYNLVTTLVTRRDQLVLKRFRTGEVGDAEILTGTAAPAIAMLGAQLVIGTVAAAVFLGLGPPTNVLLVVVAVGVGTLLCVLLAAVTAIRTSSTEMAQLTATPLMMVSFLLSGAMFPLSALPGPLPEVARALPLTPVVELLRLGLGGIAPDGSSVGFAGSFPPAAVPVLVLAAWVGTVGWAARRWFSWEPRR